MPAQALINSFTRVWFSEGGTGPSRPRSYYGNWKPGSPSWDQGDLTTVYEPDPDRYGKFVKVARFRGEPGDPEITITARFGRQRSVLLKAARRDCAHTLQLHIGECQNPQDFARGWDKVLMVEEASITSWGTDDLGALGPDETAPINEEVPFSGTDMYEVTRLNFQEQAATLVTREVTSVYVCDAQQCGACGAPSDGCQVVLALEGGISASPGLPPTVLVTDDGGDTWAERTVSTLAANERGDGIFCVGSNVVVISSDSESLHYTTLASLIAGTQTWTEVLTGFVATKGPVAAWSLGATETWIVGEGGYIYHTDDPTAGVTVSDAGSATTENLNDVHAYDSENIVAVGANNAVVYTENGGDTWTSVTGPAVGIALNTVWMRSPTEWFVGAANGSLYYTVDSGVNWTEKSFNGSGAGQVRDLVFPTPSVGYMAHSTAAPAGRILRTIDGGYSWYVLPEGTGSIPTNDYVGKLAVCVDPNIVFGGGLGGNAVDGFLVKAA